MKIHALFTYNQLRNFTYLLESEEEGWWCIDPWDAEQVITELDQRGASLSVIVNTHEHFDHVRGNRELHEKRGASVWCHQHGLETIPCAVRGLQAREQLRFDQDTTIEVLDTPGHTAAHVCLLVHRKGRPYALLSGDTLFNAGVGNCHNGGDPETLYETIRDQILPLPDDVLIYPGHDYLINNLKFTLNREPNNLVAKKMLEQWTSRHQSAEQFHVTTMAEEREMNVFFRLSSPVVRAELGLGQDVPDKEVFLALRSARNTW